MISLTWLVTFGKEGQKGEASGLWFRNEEHCPLSSEKQMLYNGHRGDTACETDFSMFNLIYIACLEYECNI